jgi:glycosyltransferase involved in cell wall biosynthesis
MRVLVSSIACHPDYGSESAVGWKVALALARDHEVHVLTSAENRTGIETYLKSRDLKNPSFSYFGATGPYHPNRLVARGQSWLRYLIWMRQSLGHAHQLLERENFDLVHHVTYSTYRVASPLWKLGLPFVFGPVGGGEQLPWIAADSMSRGQKAQEGFRVVANTLTRFSLKIRRTIQNASVLIASNQATADMLRSLGAGRRDVRILPVVFFTDDHIRDIRSRPKARSDEANSLTLFSSGMLEGRKGLSIALHAIRMARSAGLKIDFTIPSRGPEFSYLKDLAHRLGLDDSVHFPDSLPREEYWAKLLSSDIYMAPSLRDNCPATLLEAMLSRCVPIVANCNGPAEIVSQDIGELVEPAQLEQMASDISGRLLRLAKNRAELKRKANAASDYVASNFTEARYLRAIEEAYGEALARAGRHSPPKDRITGVG